MERLSAIIGVGAVLGLLVAVTPAAGQMQPIPCSEEIRVMCGNIQPGGGRILQCLKANQPALSLACVQRVNDLETTLSGALGVCRDDWVTYCYHPRSAGETTLQCLQANKTKVSPACQKALQEGSGKRQTRGTMP